MYGSQTSLYFDILPPTFEEWVHQGPQAHPIPTDSLFHPDYHGVDDSDSESDDD